MQRFIFTLPLLTIALASQGCVIYADDCVDCGWRGGFEDDHDWRGDRGDTDEGDADYHAALDPEVIAPGQAVAASLYLDGPISYDEVVGLEFSGSVEVVYIEPRPQSVLTLIEVPLDAELGRADLTVYREDGSTVVFPSLLSIAHEPEGGTDPGDCD